jgi:hypothetical protein
MQQGRSSAASSSAISLAMTPSPGPIVLRVGEAEEVQAFLAERIYEFNANATGYFDGESFSGTQLDDAGVIRAGVCGYTWGRYRPPDTSMNVPVAYDASSDSRKRIARATSSGLPPRCIGTAPLIRSTRPGSPPLAWMSV